MPTQRCCSFLHVFFQSRCAVGEHVYTWICQADWILYQTLIASRCLDAFIVCVNLLMLFSCSTVKFICKLDLQNSCLTNVSSWNLRIILSCNAVCWWCYRSQILVCMSIVPIAIVCVNLLMLFPCSTVKFICKLVLQNSCLTNVPSWNLRIILSVFLQCSLLMML